MGQANTRQKVSCAFFGEGFFQVAQYSDGFLRARALGPCARGQCFLKARMMFIKSDMC